VELREVIAQLEKKLKDKEDLVSSLTAQIAHLKVGDNSEPPPIPGRKSKMYSVDRSYLCRRCANSQIAAGNALEQREQREYVLERMIAYARQSSSPVAACLPIAPYDDLPSIPQPSPLRPTQGSRLQSDVLTTSSYMVPPIRERERPSYMDSVYYSIRLNR